MQPITEPFFILYMSKCHMLIVKDLITKNKTARLIKEVKIFVILVGEVLLKQDSKAQSIRRNFDEFNHIKIQDFFF